MHTVRKGDTLYGLSKQYGVTVKEIRQLNDISGSRIDIGQKLKIKPLEESPKPVKKPEKPKPAPEKLPKQIIGTVSTESDKPKPTANIGSAAASADTATVTIIPQNLPEDYIHVVQPKENLYRIALNADIALKDLLRFNDFADEHVIIKPGQKIIIKDPAAYQKTAATSETENESETILTAAPEPDSVLIEKVYIVQRKDTLYKIARENNMTVEELKRLNKLTSNSINVGQKLYIIAPKGQKPSETVTEVITEEDLKTKAKIRNDLIMPVDGKILSEYGIRNGRPHKGMDIGAAAGMPVYAVLDGTIVYSGIQGNYGNVVVIEHPEFVMTVYAHNEKNLVSVGDLVKQGQIIATIGSTGNATAPHVHFEYRIKGKAINPRKVLPLGA